VRRLKDFAILLALAILAVIATQPKEVSHAWLVVNKQPREYVGVSDTANNLDSVYWLKFPIGSVSVASEVATISWPGAPGNALTKIDNYVMTTSDLGKNIQLNSASNKTITLPSMGAAEDGAIAMFEKLGTGRMTLDAADTDYVHDSGAGDGCYNDVGQTYATITLKYCHTGTRWYFLNGFGTWVTYD